MAGNHYADAVDHARGRVMTTLAASGDGAALEAAVGTLVGAAAALAAVVGPGRAAQAVRNVAGGLGVCADESPPPRATIQ